MTNTEQEDRMKLARVLMLTVVIASLTIATIYAGGKTEKTGTADGVTHFTMAAGWGDRLSPAEQRRDPYVQYVEKTLGTAPIHYGWEWEGGVGYVQGLRLALAGGDRFDMIMPWDEILTAELITSGVARPLDDLIDRYAPEIWSWYSEADWQVIRSLGNGKVMFLPRRPDDSDARAGFIRKDWLERVGMNVPTTRDELLAVYRAFRDNDVSGSGRTDDEIPVSGRLGLRWLDDLFVMHGVAMYEGHPQWSWNPEKGILESAQVSDNMKMALEFIKQLIDEGLMDRVMPVQPQGDWQQKINAGEMGHFFHVVKFIYGFSGFFLDDPDPDETGLRYWDVMPLPPKVPGVPQQKNIHPTMMEPVFMITNWAERPDLIMKWLSWSVSDEGYLFRYLGIPDVHWRRVGNAVEVIKPHVTMPLPVHYYLYKDDNLNVVNLATMGPLKVDLIEKLRGKTVGLDNTGMPTSVYQGFEDLHPTSARLFREYASRFVLGEIPFTRWDEYVREWNNRGGRVVTERATTWYKSVNGID